MTSNQAREAVAYVPPGQHKRDRTSPCVNFFVTPLLWSLASQDTMEEVAVMGPILPERPHDVCPLAQEALDLKVQ